MSSLKKLKKNEKENHSEVILRILFIYAKLNPAVEYV